MEQYSVVYTRVERLLPISIRQHFASSSLYPALPQA